MCSLFPLHPLDNLFLTPFDLLKSWDFEEDYGAFQEDRGDLRFRKKTSLAKTKGSRKKNTRIEEVPTFRQRGFPERSSASLL
ncbi:hypothetical protein SAY87_019578 [Trapa incisa]|uniref:Uncharacterized protein n=1 Tax=Trapa incisa TaxID=236973 RepID=A0AAN7K2L4_9MYRT|nr:hypothetical protein SAY87_019578 [Trapa incisa]